MHNPLHAHLLALSHIYIYMIVCQMDNSGFMPTAIWEIHTHIYIYIYSKQEGVLFVFPMGSWGSSVVKCQSHDWKVMGLSGGRIFFSWVNFLCWLLFWYLFQPSVDAVACKRSQSFCKKFRWQVTAGRTCTLYRWLQMKWHYKLVHFVWFNRMCAETVAVLCGLRP